MSLDEEEKGEGTDASAWEEPDSEGTLLMDCSLTCWSEAEVVER